MSVSSPRRFRDRPSATIVIMWWTVVINIEEHDWGGDWLRDGGGGEDGGVGGVGESGGGDGGGVGGAKNGGGEGGGVGGCIPSNSSSGSATLSSSSFFLAASPA